MALESGKFWEGKLTSRRKTGDTVRLDTKVVPVRQMGPPTAATGARDW